MNKSSDVDLNLIVRAASFDLYLLPSLPLKHEVCLILRRPLQFHRTLGMKIIFKILQFQIGDLHLRFAQSKVMTLQLDIHHHELFLDAEEIEMELRTHLPLPQIFIRGEKVYNCFSLQSFEF